MKRQFISENADRIWKVLIRIEEISLRELSERLQLRQEDVAIAIGWLAREDKVIIQRIGDDIILFNCEMYKFAFG